MIPGIDLKVDDFNNIIIKDTTIYDPSNSEGVDFKNYRKEDTESIFVLEYHYKENYISYNFEHIEDSEYKIKIPKDGWITIHHLIIPTKKYILDKLDILNKQYGYYIDEGQVYDIKHTDDKGNPKKVAVEELMLINLKVSTIREVHKECVSIYNMQNCFTNICLSLFDNLGDFGQCFKPKGKNDDLIFRRDIVWMAINVIKYLVRFNMYAKADSIINQIEGCNGVCTDTLDKTVSGCGCNQ